MYTHTQDKIIDWEAMSQNTTKVNIQLLQHKLNISEAYGLTNDTKMEEKFSSQPKMRYTSKAK